MNLETKDFYHVQRAAKSETSAVTCDHGCHHVLQLVSNRTNQTELEVCEIDAERIAGLLLEAVESAAKCGSSK